MIDAVVVKRGWKDSILYQTQSTNAGPIQIIGFLLPRFPPMLHSHSSAAAAVSKVAAFANPSYFFATSSNRISKLNRVN